LLSVVYGIQEVYYLETGTVGSCVKSGLSVERGYKNITFEKPGLLKPGFFEIIH
jgi:hypothetical protein